MLVFPVLRRPIIGAPMAGGQSTPELVHAVSAAGGVGFLAGAYLDLGTLADQIRRVRTAGTDVFGVNLFVPDNQLPDPLTSQHLEKYRAGLAGLAEDFGVAPLPVPAPDDHGWGEKVDMLVADPVPMVSFTFGLPDAETVRRLHAVDTLLIGTVTTVEEARLAVDRGLDAIVAQGPEAGGHRATFHTTDPAPQPSLSELLAGVLDAVDLPVIAAGGISNAEEVGRLLGMGTEAVQVGTALLRTPEAGTSSTHRSALSDPTYARTVVTRAFTGRWARALHNEFVDRFDALAPAVFPHVHQISAPVRQAATSAGQGQFTHLWAGVGWRQAREEPAADVVARLTPG